MTPIHGRIKEADYVAAQWLHIKPRPVFAVIGGLLLLLSVSVLIRKPTWELALALAVMAGMIFIYMPYKARRGFRQYKALAEPVSVEVREEGLFFKRDTGEGLVPWSHVVKWKYNAKLLLLYPTSAMFYLIPSHFFQNDIAFSDFVKLVKARVGGTE